MTSRPSEQRLQLVRDCLFSYTAQLRLMKEMTDILNEALQLAILIGYVAISIIMVRRWHPVVLRSWQLEADLPHCRFNSSGIGPSV